MHDFYVQCLVAVAWTNPRPRNIFEIKMILFGTLVIFINEGDLDLKYCIQCTAATCRLLNQENKAKERVRIAERHLANTTSSSTTTLCDGKVTGLMVVSAMSSNI